MATMEFVPTRASAVIATAEDKFQFVAFQSHKSSRKRKVLNADTIDTDEPIHERKGIDIKRARREIIKFGMSGFDNKKQEEAKIALAVSLGAKPPKNKYKNYKSLLEQKKRDRSELETKKSMQLAGKNSLSVSTAKKKNFDKSQVSKRKMNNNLLGKYGKASMNTSKINDNKKNKSKKK